MQSESYKFSIDELIISLDVDLEKGLTNEEAEERILTYGKNVYTQKKKDSILIQILRQLQDPIVLILLGATVISALTGNKFEAVLIAGIVIFMAMTSVFLERKADNAVEKLKKLSGAKARVLRDSNIIEIESEFVVPGDILILHDGDKIAADARICKEVEISVDESILTGESIPVRKIIEAIPEDTALGDQKNMAFSGTFIVEGSGKGIVVGTGDNSELGKIAHKLSEAEEKKTPLQLQLESLSRFLFIGTIVICSLIIGLSFYRGEELFDALIQSLSLAIAFIPEGLTAVMTVVLAIGVREMVKKDVIIKRLTAAEGLGSVSAIATDKTGTITTGKMSVEKIWTYNKEYVARDFKADGPLENNILEIIKYCNNLKGATEKALVDFLESKNISFELENRVKEHRFSSSVKRMSVVHQIDEKYTSFSKGAPDVLIFLCGQYYNYDENKIYDLSGEKQKDIIEQAEKYASEGFRVLALAKRDLDNSVDFENREEIESEMVFMGLVCLMDPLRVDVKDTIATFYKAGIQPIIITGDHPEIAKTIAVEAGIGTRENLVVVTGIELNTLLENKDYHKILKAQIFARVTPEHKERIVNIYSEHGNLIAMAGDGINDVVAITKSDIGIAVSNAVDIVKDASDVVITGSYSALANAVEVGRLVMFRTRLYIHYLLSGNFCQVGIFVIALVFNTPFPLTPIALLIINVLTDAAPAMAMAVEKENDLLSVPPKKASEGIINSKMYKSIFIQGIVSTIYLFAVFYMFLPHGDVYAQSATFTAYIFQKLMRGFTARSFDKSIFTYGILSNKFMLVSVIIGILVWGIVLFGLPDLFEMERLELKHLGLLVVSALVIPLFEEIYKKLVSPLINK